MNLVLLFAPIALYRRRLSLAWVLPLALWIMPGAESHGRPGVILAALALSAGAVALAIRQSDVSTRTAALSSP